MDVWGPLRAAGFTGDAARAADAAERVGEIDLAGDDGAAAMLSGVLVPVVVERKLPRLASGMPLRTPPLSDSAPLVAIP